MFFDANPIQIIFNSSLWILALHIPRTIYRNNICVQNPKPERDLIQNILKCKIDFQISLTRSFEFRIQTRPRPDTKYFKRARALDRFPNKNRTF